MVYPETPIPASLKSCLRVCDKTGVGNFVEGRSGKGGGNWRTVGGTTEASVLGLVDEKITLTRA